MSDATTGSAISSPPRVLWLIRGLGPGGAERLLVTFARLMPDGSAEIDVVYTRADKTQLVPELEEFGISAIPLTDSWRRRLSGLRRLLGASRYDVVHAHSPLLAAIARLVILTLPPSRRPMLVTTEHNEWGAFRWPTRIINALTAPLDDHRFVVSERARLSMWPWVARKSEVLIQGIEFGLFTPSPDARTRIRSELGISDGAVLACTVANLRRPKDYPNLLRAVRILRDEGLDLTTVVVGQGPLKAEIEDLHEELELGGSVIFLGYRGDVPDLLAAADIFIIASSHEGGPLTLIEAMRAGLGIASTDVGFVSDAMKSGVEGYIVPPRDPSALAEALKKLALDEELRIRFGAAARMASEQFDVNVTISRQLDRYRTALSPRLSGGSREPA